MQTLLIIGWYAYEIGMMLGKSSSVLRLILMFEGLAKKEAAGAAAAKQYICMIIHQSPPNHH
jgi:hypothetical protein